MGTTKADIRGWLERGQAQNATHMIVATDTYDWGDYPVFVSADQDVHKVEAQHEKVMEVYRLDLDWDQQLNQFRAYNY